MRSARAPRAPRRAAARPTAGGFRWYFPSWNGDLRIGPHPEDANRTLLEIVRPTADEQRIVNEIGRTGVERGWLPSWEPFVTGAGAVSWEFVLDAPVATVGIVVAATMKPGPGVLTNIRFSDGSEVAATGSGANLRAALADAGLAPEASAKADGGVAAPDGKPEEPKAPRPKAPRPKAAATVKRPTPCCPRCVPGSIGPAREVLLSFLDPEQHEQWARSRTLVVEGGITGARYLLAHRETQVAARIGRICYDLDERAVVHFHDTAVPPEEEVLAALLILRHREAWLRNEATMFACNPRRIAILKNPFGDVSDGAADSQFMHALGSMFVP